MEGVCISGGKNASDGCGPSTVNHSPPMSLRSPPKPLTRDTNHAQPVDYGETLRDSAYIRSRCAINLLAEWVQPHKPRG